MQKHANKQATQQRVIKPGKSWKNDEFFSDKSFYLKTPQLRVIWGTFLADGAL